MRTKRLSATILLSLACMMLFGLTAFAGTWQRDGNGWWYMRDDGSYPANVMSYIDGEWYAFNQHGYMVSNDWVMAEGQWYYMSGSGAMMRNQWIGNYYLGDDGMAAKV